MLYDISPLVTSSTAVFPGDTALTREVLLDHSRGDNLTLSTIRATCHLGAHIDAPSHYGESAESIEAMALEVCIGRCQVMKVEASPRQRIGIDDLPGEVTAERLLISTGSFPDPHDFNDDFAAIDPALVETLAAGGLRLLGVDTPSVDVSDSKDLPSHSACLAHGVTILEGVVLSAVPDGIYELIALPLHLEGFDASPVRAVLRTLPTV